MWSRTLCLLIALTSLPVMAAEIYKTRDKDGNVVYTDKPPAGPSEQLSLPPINTLNAPGYQPVAPTIQRNADEEISYRVNIISPRDEVVIPPGERDLAIVVGLDPSLAQDHWIVYYINGEMIEETRSTSILIQEITRGAHQITVDVIDANGKVLGESQSVPVNVIRPTVKQTQPIKPTPR